MRCGHLGPSSASTSIVSLATRSHVHRVDARAPAASSTPSVVVVGERTLDRPGDGGRVVGVEHRRRLVEHLGQ